nr:BBE domain-containing protein [Azospirillum sp. A1-3]
MAVSGPRRRLHLLPAFQRHPLNFCLVTQNLEEPPISSRLTVRKPVRQSVCPESHPQRGFPDSLAAGRQTADCPTAEVVGVCFSPTTDWNVTKAAGPFQNVPARSLTNWQRAYCGENLARLAQVNKTVDPIMLFTSAQAIGPV